MESYLIRGKIVRDGGMVCCANVAYIAIVWAQTHPSLMQTTMSY